MKETRRATDGQRERRSRGTSGGEPQAVALRVCMLGGFRVSVGSRTIGEDGWRLRKAASLVKMLALAEGHRLHREQATDRLWRDLDGKAQANNLRHALHLARKTLEPAAPATASRYLRLQGEQIALCPGGALWVDVEAFEEAATAARRSKEPAAYRTALDLYAGDLLPGDLYEEWTEDHRERLRRTRLSLLVELAGLQEERGELGSALEALGKVVASEPAHEEAHIGLVRLYALAGRRAEALRQYGRLEEVLARELVAEPGAAGRRLREEIRAGTFPPGRSRQEAHPPEVPLGADRHNLPADRTSFVGRGRELAEVKRALAMTRLLTLTGAGGSGKTRLALEVARNLVSSYPDGAWLAELAPLSEGTLLPQVVASSLRVREQPGRALADTLVDHLRKKHLLLVLDNCEHVVDAAARLVDALLSACPRLRILATSREALRTDGEVVWRVPPLSVPDPDKPSSVEELGRSEAVRLFLERARYRRQGFELTDGNAGAVAEICQRLDGIPLALELAAARVGVLSAGQISARLDGSLALLRGGGRTILPRHQTLRGALDWSHNFLSEPEKSLFRRLSVFAAGWPLEAAEAVGPGGGVGAGDVLDLLELLVDKSMVVTETGGEDVRRYRLLEPVRQYARERLEESGEAEETRHRHAAFFLMLAEEAEQELTGPAHQAWLERLETEHDNLRAALSWAIDGGDPELGLRLAAALWLFWYTHGHLAEGRDRLEKALSKTGQL